MAWGKRGDDIAASRGASLEGIGETLIKSPRMMLVNLVIDNRRATDENFSGDIVRGLARR